MDFELSEEQQRFKQIVKEYVKEHIVPLCEEADAKGELSREAWSKLGKLCLGGLPFPEEYGGQGSDVLTVT
jgi:alkylation response protein AidB-like acyl-CoA dehydrogenase